MKVGVLAVQGAFAEMAALWRRKGADVFEIRQLADLLCHNRKAPACFSCACRLYGSIKRQYLLLATERSNLACILISLYNKLFSFLNTRLYIIDQILVLIYFI